jgi:hypothetical protein
MANRSLQRSCLGLAVILATLQLTACVSQQHSENRACGIGKTLVCVEHVGKIDQCTCKTKESMKDILEQL